MPVKMESLKLTRRSQAKSLSTPDSYRVAGFDAETQSIIAMDYQTMKIYMVNVDTLVSQIHEGFQPEGSSVQVEESLYDSRDRRLYFLKEI